MNIECTIKLTADDREIRDFVDGRIDKVLRVGLVALVQGLSSMGSSIGNVAQSPGGSAALADLLSKLGAAGIGVPGGGAAPPPPPDGSGGPEGPCACPAAPPGHVHRRGYGTPVPHVTVTPAPAGGPPPQVNAPAGIDEGPSDDDPPGGPGNQ